MRVKRIDRAGSAEAVHADEATLFAQQLAPAHLDAGLDGNARTGIAAKVVSVPSMELLARQSDAYKAGLYGNAKVRVAIEAGIEMSWSKLLGDKGRFVGMHGFGASGKIEDLYEYFGITPKAIVEAVTAQL